jgi:hypothetical protein
MQVPSWLVSLIIAMVLGAMWQQIAASCIAHGCWLAPYL